MLAASPHNPLTVSVNSTLVMCLKIANSTATDFGFFFRSYFKLCQDWQRELIGTALSNTFYTTDTVPLTIPTVSN